MKFRLSYSAVLMVFSFITLTSKVFSQSGWILQPSMGRPVTYTKIKFINSQTGFMVGGSNKIFRTTNTGEIWTETIIQEPTNDLRDIYFINESTGYIAGGYLTIDPPSLYATSIILKTTNSGINWNTVFHDTSQAKQKHLSTITFVNANTGYAAGGLYGMGENYLYKTINGGNTWSEIPFGDNLMFPFQMKFVNNNNGVAVLFGKILKTSDSGVNWTSTFGSSFVNGLFFVNENTGYVSGGNLLSNEGTSLILKTTDIGNTWQTVFNSTGTRFGLLNSIFFYKCEYRICLGILFPWLSGYTFYNFKDD